MSQNSVDDLVMTYWGWMYAIQDTPVYKKMRREQLVKTRNEIKAKSPNWKEEITAGDPHNRKIIYSNGNISDE